MTVELRYNRGDESRVTSGVLGPAPGAVIERQPPPDDLGLQLLKAELPKALRESLRRRHGVYVDGIEFGSPACQTTLRSGDMITAVEGRDVANVGEVMQELERTQDDEALIEVFRGKAKQTLELPVAEAPRTRIARAQRRRLLEAELAQPPWESAEAKDFSWAAWTIVAVKAANTAYQQYLVDEQRRIEEYNRRMAANPPRPVITEDRNGNYRTYDATGRGVTIDATTADMLRSNPGLSVLSANRRGSGFAVYDRSGSVIQRGDATRTTSQVFVTAPVPPDMSGVWERQMEAAMELNDARDIGRLGNPYKAFFR